MRARVRDSNSFPYARMSHAQKPLSHLLKPQPPDISGNGDCAGMPMLSAHHRLCGVCVIKQKVHGSSIEKECCTEEHSAARVGSGSNRSPLVDIIVTCSPADAFNHSEKSFICACDRSGASAATGMTGFVLPGLADRSPHLLNSSLLQIGSRMQHHICPIQRYILLLTERGAVRHGFLLVFT